MLDIEEDANKSSTLDISAFEETPTPKKRGRPRKVKPEGEAKPAKVPKASKQPPRTTPEALALIQRHRESYVYACGANYSTATLAFDVKAAHAIIKTYGLAKSLELLDAFFSSTDPFIKNSPFDFGTFKGVVPRLVLKNQGPPKIEASLTLEDLS